MRSSLLALALISTALPAFADEVNVYSHRQPELLQPLVDAFTAETGIAVNVAFVDKGMAERLVAEGDRSPADLVLTVDIARLMQVVDAGVIQPVQSDVLEANIPESLRDPADQWFGLTSRARIVYASKERVQPGEVTTYEDLADPKWSDDELIDAMLAHPILINRPVVETPLGTRLCRPSELVLDILPQAQQAAFPQADHQDQEPQQEGGYWQEWQTCLGVW